MYVLYSLFLIFFRIALGALSLFDSKIKKGIEGRKKLFSIIEKYYTSASPGQDLTVGRTLSPPITTPDGLTVRPTIDPLRKRILIHVSSFGELEQAKPVIAAIKKQYPEVHIHLTFFSPSGYENSVNIYEDPDIITYLPFDSQTDIEWFLDITKPDLVLFVRYDLWHNFVRELHDRHIPMILFSATFDTYLRKALPLIRNLYRKTYSFVNTILTISERDKQSLEKLAVHPQNIIVAGDTRCDQVIARKKDIEESENHPLPEPIRNFIAENNLRVFVAGSTWASDEQIIIPSLKASLAAGEKLLVIIVPHEVDEDHISNLRNEFGSDGITLTAISQFNGEKVIIVDSIGKLFALYQYASFAYVGGGFSSGVHNVLEPAVWGVPSIVGPNHKRSKEIAALIGSAAVVEIRSKEQFEDAFQNWILNQIPRTLASVAAKDFVYASQGATERIMEKIDFIINPRKSA